MKPLVVVNFKVYKESIGENALRLAKICETFSKKYKQRLWICVNPVDLKIVASRVKIPVLSQSIDHYDYGKHTGSILAEAVKKAGAYGTLLNHSEKRISLFSLKKSLLKCRKLNLKTIVCVKTAKEAVKVARLKPDFIAIEPPTLIGGNVSVSKAKPFLIKNTVAKVKKIDKKIIVLCGAGIHTKEDIDVALNLGVKGVLLASGVVLTKNKLNALKKLLL